MDRGNGLLDFYAHRTSRYGRQGWLTRIRGFTMLEIVLVLAVGLGLIVAGTSIYGKVEKDRQYAEMEQNYINFMTNIEAAIRKKFTGPGANKNGAFNKEIETMLKTVYKHQPKTTIDARTNFWSYEVNGDKYHLFIYPYPAISRFFETAAECQLYLARVQKSYMLSLPHVLVNNRCSNPDRRGVGITYTRFKP